MSDVTISFTIPEAKVSKAMEGFLELYPNEERVSEEPDAKSKYTNAQWVKEKIRRIIVREVSRGLQLKANKEAVVNTDDDVIT